MNATEAVDKMMELSGSVAAIIVDSSNGLVMASRSNGFDTDAAAAGNTRVVQTKRDTMKMLNLDDKIEHILITLGSQLHIIYLLPSNDEIFGYLVVDKKTVNLGMALSSIKSALQGLEI